MALPAIVPLGVLALLLVASSSSAEPARQTTPASGPPPPVPPGGGGGPPAGPPGGDTLSPPAVAAITEVRQVAGQPVRYFKPHVRQVILSSLSSASLVPMPSPVTGAAAFRVVSSGGVPAAASLSAATQQGLIIAGNHALAAPQSADRYVLVVHRNQLGLISPSGPHAVVLDPAEGAGAHTTPPAVHTPPGFPPGTVPHTTAPPPGVPPRPPTVPGVPPPVPPTNLPANVPPGMPPSVPPGIIPVNVPPGPPSLPIPGQPPGTPPGITPGDGLDPQLPTAMRAELTAMLADEDIAPEALEQAAKSLGGKYPLAAARLRARAGELRDLQKLAHMKRGGSPFVVRPGDIPHRLASHYTGDGTRWREIIGANGHLNMRTVSRGGATHIEPWRGEILLPLAWEAWSKPMPPVASKRVLSSSEKAADAAVSEAEKKITPKRPNGSLPVS